jgi:putative transposase
VLPGAGRLPLKRFDWRRRAADPSAHAQADRWLLGQIRRIHRDSGGAYGAPRIHAELQIACGVRVGRERVVRLLRAAAAGGLPSTPAVAAGPGPPRPTGRAGTEPVPAPVQPTLAGPHVACDDLELPTDEGPLYLVAALDGCSRLVGHAMGERATAELAIAALQLAVWRRGLVDGDGLIHHSDQGSPGQFTSLAFGGKLQQLGIQASMGSVGDCFDHALIESFFATLECELIDQRHWRTREEARLEAFWWIQAVDNRTRRHSALGYLSLVEYEAMLGRHPKRASQASNQHSGEPGQVQGSCGSVQISWAEQRQNRARADGDKACPLVGQWRSASRTLPRQGRPRRLPRKQAPAGNRLVRGSPGGIWAGDIPLYRRAVSGQRSGTPAPYLFKLCARRCRPEASGTARPMLARPTDPLLAKPVRAGSCPGKVVSLAGHGHCGVVRGCPLGTGQDRHAWHGSGTAGEDDVRRAWQRAHISTVNSPRPLETVPRRNSAVPRPAE